MKLSNSSHIPFDKLEIKHLAKEVQAKYFNVNLALKQVISAKSKRLIYASLIPLDLAIYELNYAFGIVNHLLSVNDSAELRKIQAKFEPLITKLYLRLMQNSRIYNRYVDLDNSNTLDSELHKVVKNSLRDFYLSGIKLKTSDKTTLKQVQTKLSELNTKFEHNVLDATDHYSKYVTKKQLSSLDEETIAQYQTKRKARDSYKITLKLPSYLPIMQYCSNRLLRKTLYHAYTTLASKATPKWDNTNLIPQILHLRTQKAQLLGFNNYSEYAFYTKMARSSVEALDFLYNLAHQSRNKALSDLEELKDFAKIKNLNAYDIPYYSEALRKHKYSYSNLELKQYFPLPKVIEGLFKLINQLYGIRFKQNMDIPTWNEHVISYEVINRNQTIGYFYLDLYARVGKQGGAWMNALQEKYKTDKFDFLPMAYIICNFTPPLGDSPSLLTFDDVQTLFHETGHALHQLLSKVNHYAISGINGVEWDSVELPSQFMEYFAWNLDVLKLISSHVKTGDTIPQNLYNKLTHARHFQSGMDMLKQLEYSIYDILLHSQTKPVDYHKLLREVRDQIAVVFPPRYNTFPNTFTHIFSGGYACGYYSYKWAEVMACDVFSVFDQAGFANYKTHGMKFYKEVLSQGGLRDSATNFKQFMGRAPKIDALLKYSGIK